MELVSVIIPTYKRGNMLEKTILSVLNQTYKKLEIIIVDDNANFPDEREKTRKIVNKYLNANRNLKLIENAENLGGAITRNIGIKNSKGKYIAFLDDDDLCIATRIEKQINLMKEKEMQGKKVGMIYCYKYNYYDDGTIQKARQINVEGNCLVEHLKNKMETTSTWLCPKKVLEDVNFFENVKAHQDNILLMKMLGAGYEIYRVPEYLINFYMHNGNGITNKNKKYIEYTKTLIEYKKKYYSLLSKKEIEEVEYVNSCMLIRLYKRNNMKAEFIQEIKKVIKNNKFRLYTIKMMLFYFLIKE